jgi:hypothetical protein
MRGGLVADIAKINSTIGTALKDNKQKAANCAVKAELATRWKIAIVGAITTGVVALINFLKDYIPH